MGYSIAIDFGNSNIKATVFREGKIKKIKLNSGNNPENHIENIIHYKKDEILLGERARTLGGGKIITGIKQQLEKKDWSAYISELGVKKNAIDVVGDILNKIVEKVKSSYGKNNEVLEDCLITVPVNFSEYQKEKIKKACKNMGIPLKALVTEPVAGALKGVNEMLEDMEDGEEKNFFVFDFGGGTLDIALINVEKDDEDLEFRVLGSIGINYGGILINNLILDKCVAPKLASKDFLKKREHRETLLSKIEKLKTTCLGEEEEEGELLLLDSEYNFEIETQTIEITRDEMEKVIFDTKIKERIFEMFDYLLEEEGLEKEDIDKITLIGGSSRIICIQEMIKEYIDDEDVFDIDELDEEIFYAVAEGAGEYLKILKTKNSNIKIENKIPYELITKDINGREVRILSKNSTFEQETALKRFRDISNAGNEEEATLYQRFKGIGDEKDLELVIGKVKCNKKKFDDYIYYSFCLDKYGEISCKYYNGNRDNFVEDSKIIVEE